MNDELNEKYRIDRVHEHIQPTSPSDRGGQPGPLLALHFSLVIRPHAKPVYMNQAMKPKKDLESRNPQPSYQAALPDGRCSRARAAPPPPVAVAVAVAVVEVAVGVAVPLL